MNNSCDCSRRRFLQAGAAAGIALSAARPSRSEPVRASEWRPCVDMGGQINNDNIGTPLDLREWNNLLRNSPSDLPAPVDVAIYEANPGTRVLGDEAPSRDLVERQLAPPGETRERGLGDSVPIRLAFRNKWELDTLRVYFYPDGHSSSLRRRVLEVANKWCEEGGVQFREVQNRTDANIRVAFQNTGHWSYVGTENARVGGQTMNLQMTSPPRDDEYNHGVILHEFGHSIGCIHEHQQPGAQGFFNEDAVLEYYKRQYGWGTQKTLLNVLNRYQRNELLRFSDFDEKSVMLYSYPGELTSTGRGTEKNVVLSATDKEYVRKVYGEPNCEPGTTETETETEPEPESPGGRASTGTLTVNGAPTEAAIGPGTPTNVFDFEISSAGTYLIRTAGYTQVELSLRKDGTEIDAEKRTPDLVNQYIQQQFEAGRYQVVVTHRYPGGGGEYAIQLKTAP